MDYGGEVKPGDSLNLRVDNVSVSKELRDLLEMEWHSSRVSFCILKLDLVDVE